MKKRIVAVALLTALIAATTAFIWWQSLRPADNSNEISSGLKQWLINLLGPWVDTVMPADSIRKVAHFAEFALLGGEWGALSRVCRRRWLWAWGGLTAVADELLQFLSPGRAPTVTDVLLDWAGYAAGVALVLLIWRWLRRLRRS